jgi:RNA polymerase sigma factor (sigma-70 family)
MVAPTASRRACPSPASDQLIEQHMAFARTLAHRLRQRLAACADAEQLESDAYLGLLMAARSFNPQRQVKFRTYAARRIYGAMLDGLRQREACRRRHPRPHTLSLDKLMTCDDGRSVPLGDLVADEQAPVGSELEMRDGGRSEGTGYAGSSGDGASAFQLAGGQHHIRGAGGPGFLERPARFNNPCHHRRDCRGRPEARSAGRAVADCWGDRAVMGGDTAGGGTSGRGGDVADELIHPALE